MKRMTFLADAAICYFEHTPEDLRRLATRNRRCRAVASSFLLHSTLKRRSELRRIEEIARSIPSR